MPFIALHKDSGERIDITQIADPRAVLKSGDCVCQLCGEPLILKAGLLVAAHFAHYAACTSDYAVHPESEAHRRGKQAVAQYLRQHFTDEQTSPQIEFEVKVPEARRIADVMITFPMGWRVAHEVQLARITTAELQQRTEDYAKAGIDTTWWLGKEADTPANRAWCMDKWGECYTLRVWTNEMPGVLYREPDADQPGILTT